MEGDAQGSGLRPHAFFFLDQTGTPVMMPGMSWEELDRLQGIREGLAPAGKPFIFESLEIDGVARGARAEVDVRLRLTVEPTGDRRIAIPLKMSGLFLLEPASMRPRVTSDRESQADSEAGDSEAGDSEAGDSEAPETEASGDEPRTDEPRTDEISGDGVGPPTDDTGADDRLGGESISGVEGYWVTAADEGGGYVLWMQTSSRVTAELGLRASSRVEGGPSGRWRLDLPEVPAAVRLRVEQPDLRGEVVGRGDEVVRSESLDTGGTELAVESGGGNFELRWSPRDRGGEDSPLLEADSNVVVRWDGPQDQPIASIQMSIRSLRAGLVPFTVRLPARAILLEPPTVRVGTRELEIPPADDDPGGPWLRVPIPDDLRTQRVEIAMDLQLENMGATADSPFELAVPRVLGVLRHEGDLEIETTGEYRLRWEPENWVRSVIGETFGEGSSRPRYRFRFDRDTLRLPLWLAAQRRQLRLQCELSLLLHESTAQLMMEIRPSGQSVDGRLTLDLAGWRLRTVSDGDTGEPIDTFERDDLLELTLNTRGGEEPAPLRIAAEWDGSGGVEDLRLRLPRVIERGPAVLVQESSLRVRTSGRKVFVIDLAASSGIDRLNDSDAEEEGSIVRRFRMLPSDAPVELAGSLVEQPQRVTLAGNAVVELDGDELQTTVDWTVSGQFDMEGRLAILIDRPTFLARGGASRGSASSADGVSGAAGGFAAGGPGVIADGVGSGDRFEGAEDGGGSAPGRVPGGAGPAARAPDVVEGAVTDTATDTEPTAGPVRFDREPTIDVQAWTVSVDDVAAVLRPLDGDRYELISDRLTAGPVLVRWRHRQSVPDDITDSSPLRVMLPRPAIPDTSITGDFPVLLRGDDRRELIWASQSADNPRSLEALPREPLRMKVQAVTAELPELVIEQAVLRTAIGDEMRHEQVVANVRGGDRFEIELPPWATQVIAEARIDGRVVSVRRTGNRLGVGLPGESQRHRVDVRIWLPIESSAALAHVAPAMRLPPGVGRVYWQLVVPKDLHVVWAAPAAGRAMQWRFDRWWLTREPIETDSSLAEWMGVDELTPMPSGNRFLYVGSSISGFRVSLASKGLIWLVVGSFVLLTGTLLTYVPGTRHPLVAVLGVVLVTGLAVLSPDAAILAGQLGALAVGLVAVMLGMRMLLAPIPGSRALAPAGTLPRGEGSSPAIGGSGGSGVSASPTGRMSTGSSAIGVGGRGGVGSRGGLREDSTPSGLAETQSMRRPTALLLLFSLGGVAGRAEEPPVRPADGEATAEASEADRGWAWPAQVPREVRLRPLFLFASQLAGLVPDDYRPISIERFGRTLESLASSEEVAATGRLTTAWYEVRLDDEMLHSERSVWTFEAQPPESHKSQPPTSGRIPLGEVSLAISGLGRESAGRLENHGTGMLSAVIPGPGALEFAWTLRGRGDGNEREFELLIPRAPRGVIRLDSPEGVAIEVLDGALSETGEITGFPGTVEGARRFSPGPEGAATQEGEQASRSRQWIDVGGLHRVRLRVRPAGDPETAGLLLLRRSVTQCDIDRGGLAWTQRMTVELAGRSQLADLMVHGGRVTSVTVESSDIPFTVTRSGRATQQLRLSSAAERIRAGGGRLTVTVSGRSEIVEAGSWMALPRCQWRGPRVLESSADHQVQLRLREPLRLLGWELPPGWTPRPDSRLSEDFTTLQAQGPPPGPRDESEAWSRIRLTSQPAVSSGDMILSLTLGHDSLRASARLQVSYAAGRLEPLRFRVQSGWMIRSLRFPRSDRIVESPTADDDGTLRVWPEAGDLEEDGRLRVDVIAQPLRSGSRFLIEPTWLLRPEGCSLSVLAAVTPPPSLNWQGDAALHPDRILPRDLSPWEREHLGDPASGTLLFRLPTGRTPLLSLRPPGVAFDVDTELRLDLADRLLTETLVVGTPNASSSLSELTILAGPAEGKPEYRWTIAREDESGSTSLPGSKIRRSEVSGESEYVIDVSGHDLGDRRLIGRRRYPLDDPATLRLPRIPGAGSQNAVVVLGAGLRVDRTSFAVSRVPLSDARDHSVTRLRYDAIDQPEIEISARERDPRATIVWREDVRLIASSSDRDQLEVRYDVVAANPIVIESPGGWQLWRVYRGGRPVDPISRTATTIELPAGDGVREQQWRVLWHRERGFDAIGPLRWCEIPKLSISGAVTRSEYRVAASADTFSPSLAWRDARAEAAGPADSTWSETRPGARVLLLPRNVALATGWVIAGLVFTVAWWVSRRDLLPVAGLIVVAAAIVALGFPWKQPIIAWVIAPAVCGVIVAIANLWPIAGNQVQRVGGSGIDDDANVRSSRRTSRSHETSPRTAGTLALMVACSLGIAAPWCGPGRVFGQRPDGPSGVIVDAPRGGIGPLTDPGALGDSGALADSVDVLVPVDTEGRPVGDKVYLPGHVYRLLFASPDAGEVEAANFLSARYRLKLASGGAELSAVEMEAEYQISLDQPSGRVRLPLDFSTVRRVEVSQPSGDRIARFADDGDGRILVSVPPAERVRIRVTLSPQVETDDAWTSLSLRVPVVSDARVAVEGDRGIGRVAIVGALGAASSLADVGRWSAELGPVDRFTIRYQLRDRAPSRAADPLRRRFWVHVGKRSTVFDCEVVPPQPVAVGETLPLVILDAETPIVAGSTWRLDRAEQLNPSRWLVSLVRMTADDEPVRLLWRRPTVINVKADPDESDASMSIPDVLAPASKPNSPAWVAIDRSPELTLIRGGNYPQEPLSIDQFLDAWAGYQGPIDQAFVALQDLPTLIVGRRPPRVVSIRQRHHLHVTARQQELRYSAVIRRDAESFGLGVLRVPEGLTLHRVTVNDNRLPIRMLGTRSGRELPLGPFPNRDEIVVEAIATVPLPEEPSGAFTLPRLSLSPEAPVDDAYSLTRDRSIRLTEVRAPTGATGQAIDLETAEALANGWVPVGSWVIRQNAGDPDREPGTFRVARSPRRFGCDQKVALFWEQGRWTMEASIRFQDQPRPDYLDLEIPTRWCDSLQVEPATTWVRQPATETGYQVLRVRCGPEPDGDGIIRIRGRLEDQGTGRVSVPKIRVLRSRNPRVFISVPNQLTNETVRWRTGSVTPQVSLSGWEDTAFLESAWTSDEEIGLGRRTYLATGPNWSVELVSLPRVSADAVATASDMRLYAQTEGYLTLARWDLVPVGLSAVTVRLPEGAQWLGAWTSGQAVDARRLAETDQGATISGELWTVPLAVSRLSQPVEVLVRLSAESPWASDGLPELWDIPVGQRWLAVYEPLPAVSGTLRDRTASGDAWVRPEYRRRRQALAESIVVSVERSLDSLAEHPAGELAAWITDWVARYSRLAEADGHMVQWSTADDSGDAAESTASTARSENLGDASERSEQRWSAWDARIVAIADRFLDEPGSYQMPLFDESRFAGYRPVAVFRPVEESPAWEPKKSVPSSRAVQVTLANLMSLLIVAGILAVLWSLRSAIRPWLAQPAPWLVVAAILLALQFPSPVTLPVAIAIGVVAAAGLGRRAGAPKTGVRRTPF